MNSGDMTVRARFRVDSLRLSLGVLCWVLLAHGAAWRSSAQTEFGLEDLVFVEAFRGVAAPTSITHAGDGSGRLFVTEQVGRILIHDGQRLLADPFLDIRDRIRAGGERGLLSVAFHPEYASNGFFFVNYTNRAGNTVVSRFRVSETPDLADPLSETVFFTAAQPRRNHNGGQIQFGPDGFLYIGMGDGGGAGDPPNLAQDLGSVLGKLLRVDVDGDAPATAPLTNPFLATVGARPEIWAYGLRNPWRFSFDRLTGDLFLGDVGQNAVEEISFQAASSQGGENYGWRRMEGSRCFRPAVGCNDGLLVLPILEYPNHGGNCGGSVTGGYRYRGSRFPQFYGVYIFADYCTGSFYAGVEQDGMWQLRGPRETPFGVRTFGEDEAGEIYFADSSVVYRIATEVPVPETSIVISRVVSSASLEVGPGLAPGSLATVFGTGIAESTEVAPGTPLPLELGGGMVLLDGALKAPQVLASPHQRNFQVPWELGGRAGTALRVVVGEASSLPAPVDIVRVSPAVFVLDYSGQAAAVIAGTRQIAGPQGPLWGARPAQVGEVLQVYATGLGPVANPPATGSAASAEAVSATVEPVTASIGTQPMPVLFSGLVPSLVGVYQVDVQLEGELDAGKLVPLVLQVAGVDSNTTFIAVE